MPLFMGTDRGLYRADSVPFDSADTELVLECGRVAVLDSFEHIDGIYLAAEDGVYRSYDDGDTWEQLDVPEGDRYWVDGDAIVWSILATPDGGLYLGNNEPAVYRSDDEGETWRELRGFKELDSMVYWESPEDPNVARVRSLESVPGKRQRIVAGVEVGGVHYSDDLGETWTDCRDNVEDDVHHVLPLTTDCWLAATGYFDLDLEYVGLETGLGHATGWGGLYRTTDAGESWKRLDPGNDCSYIRRVFTHDGTVFFSGAEGAPPAWAEDEYEAAVFESTDFGRSWERVSYPGDSDIVIEDWLVDDNGDVLCGGGLFDIPVVREDIDGQVYRRNDDGGYETVGTVPSSIGRLELV